MWLLPLSQGRQNNQSQSFVPSASWAEAGRYPRREEQIRARSLQALASTLHRCYPPAPSQAPGQSTLSIQDRFINFHLIMNVGGWWVLCAAFSWSNHSKGTALVRALCSGNQPMAITCRVSHLCQGAVPRKLVLTMLVQVTKAWSQQWHFACFAHLETQKTGAAEASRATQPGLLSQQGIKLTSIIILARWPRLQGRSYLGSCFPLDTEPAAVCFPPIL